TVVAERPDQLVRGLRHEPRLLQVIGLETEGRELLLAPDRDVLDLVGRNGDLPPCRDATAFATDPAGVRKRLAWPAAGEVRARIVAIGAARAPRREESSSQIRLVDELPGPAAPLERDVLAGSERPRIGDVPLRRDEAALAGEHVRF